MNSLRKRLEKWIHIERSVENDDVILRQTLKYKPKKCEDCPRTCKTRRRVAIKLNYPNPWNRAKNSFYTKMCSVCVEIIKIPKQANSTSIGRRFCVIIVDKKQKNNKYYWH